MTYYKHTLSSVVDYLHHRPPYLMIDHIDSILDREVTTVKQITGDEFFLTGHFPGAPIVPGAMLQEMTTQSAGILIAANFNPMRHFNTHDPNFNEFALGVLVRVRQSKFHGFARIGDSLHVHVALIDRVGELFDFSAKITVSDRLIMRNSFQLMNVPSKLLIGDPTS